MRCIYVCNTVISPAVMQSNSCDSTLDGSILAVPINIVLIIGLNIIYIL